MLYIVFTFLGRASRYCDESSNWAEPNVLECESIEFREIRLEVLYWDQLSLVVSLIGHMYTTLWHFVLIALMQNCKFGICYRQKGFLGAMRLLRRC